MQNGPEVVFRHAGLQRLLHFSHRRFAGDDSSAHAENFVSAFDLARLFHHLLTVDDLNALLVQVGNTVRIHLIEGAAHIAAAVFAYQIGHVSCPIASKFHAAIAALEIEPGRATAHFVDHAGMIREMLARMEFKQDDRTVGRDENAAHRIVRGPQLHVGAIRGVSNVQRVVEMNACQIVLAQLGTDTVEAVVAHSIEVWIRNARRPPFALGQFAIANQMRIHRRGLGPCVIA